MKAKNLLLLALGGAVAYYGYKMYQKNKAKSNVATMPSQATMQKTCEEQWTEKAKTLRVTGDALATAKANIMLSCSPVLTATI